jgi:hypothetical protein
MILNLRYFDGRCKVVDYSCMPRWFTVSEWRDDGIHDRVFGLVTPWGHYVEHHETRRGEVPL